MKYLLLLLSLAVAGCATANGSDKLSKPRGRLFSRVSVKAEDPNPQPVEDPILLGVDKIETILEDLNSKITIKKDPNPPVDPTPITVDPPTLTLDNEVDGNVGAWLHVKATTNCQTVQWFTPDVNLNIFPQEQLKDATSTIVSSLTPGTYRLYAYTGNAAGITRPVEVLVSIHGAQPPPQPNPQPAPNPQPQPPAPLPIPTPTPSVTITSPSNLGIFTIDNPVSTSPTAPAVLGDISFWNALAAQGIETSRVSMTDGTVSTRFRQMIEATKTNQNPSGLPCIVLVDKQKLAAGLPHSWLNQGPGETVLPSTTAGIKALISKYTGGQVR